MQDDVQYGVQYDEPIQPGGDGGSLGLGGPVTRQVGLAPARQVGIDPTPPPPIIQGDPEVVAYRNPGNGAQRFASDGTLHSDRRADDNILFVDHALSDPEAMPPGLARTAMPLPPPSGFGEMTAVQQREAVKAAAIAAGFTVTDSPVEAKDSPTAFAVIASDDGAHDPRDRGDKGPMVFTADALPVIKKAPIVPVVLPTPKTRRVVAKAAPKGKK